MLDDILILNRADTGRLEYNPEDLNLKMLAGEILNEINKTKSGNNIIDLIVPEEHLFLHGDKKLIKLILNNLLSNAIKYSPGGEKINFEILLQDGHIKFIITDYGLGIPEEDKANLFEQFRRGKNVGSIKGTGLGLAIVKRSVDLHHGRITFVSKINEGSAFTVELPVKGE